MGQDTNTKLQTTVIMQNTRLGRHNLQTTPVSENYSNYPRNEMKIIQTSPAQNEIIQIKGLHLPLRRDRDFR